MNLVQEKSAQARKLVTEFGYDCWLTFVRESCINGDPVLDFILGGDVTWHSAFVFDKNGRATAIVGNFDAAAVEDTGVYDKVIGYVKSIEEPLGDLLSELDPKSIAINYSSGSEVCDGLTHGMFLYLQKLLSRISFDHCLVSAEPLLSALRQRKSPTEIARIKKAVDETEIIYSKIPDIITPGITEKQIAEFMQKQAFDHGYGMAWQPSACPAVFAGPDASSGHYGPTDRKLEPGHILHIDFGINVEGYCSDLQRGFYVLRENEDRPPEDVQNAYDTVFHAIAEAASALRPGVIGNDIDTIARSVITSAGYEEYACALGHQVGRYAHDGTALLGPKWEKYGEKPFQKIEKGMIFTIEPHVRVPGYGMASIEEMIIVTDDGCEFLSQQQREVYLISMD